MNAHPTQSGMQFLSVAEAAERLGVSRVKVREGAARGLIPFKRDNQNHLRLDLSGITRAAIDGDGGGLDQSALMHLLFDEIEELHDDLDTSGAEVDALRRIADRQAEALDKAATRMEQDAADKARLSDLLDRTLAHLEARDPGEGNTQLADVSDRALTALETTGARLEDSLSQNARFDALLERALEYAAQGKAAGEAEAKAMGDTADRALHMLEDAIGTAEKNRQAAERTGDMLNRALEAGERLEGQIAQRDSALQNRNATVEKALEMSERAVALAGVQEKAWQRRSFWQWLFGK